MKQVFTGCGLGLRSSFVHEVFEKETRPEWFEIVPENWIHMKAGIAQQFEKIAASFPLVCHGLSLSIGSNTPLDRKFLKELKSFLDRYGIDTYSEHLSFCSIDNRQLYELLPLPMTKSMVAHIADRVDEVQTILKRELILENASYYYIPYHEMEETDFINDILKKSGAKLLLDVNNVYVNSFNHHFDPKAFIAALDPEKVAYMHVAGHLEYEPDLYIDTHGEDVKEPVWELLSWTLDRGIDAPVLLERDNNIPPYDELLREYAVMKEIYERPRP